MSSRARLEGRTLKVSVRPTSFVLDFISTIVASELSSVVHHRSIDFNDVKRDTKFSRNSVAFRVSWWYSIVTKVKRGARRDWPRVGRGKEEHTEKETKGEA